MYLVKSTETYTMPWSARQMSRECIRLRENDKPYNMSAVSYLQAASRQHPNHSQHKSPVSSQSPLQLYGGTPRSQASRAQSEGVGFTSASSMENLQPSFHRQVQREPSP